MTTVGTFDYKLPGMRKPDTFSIYPRTEGGTYIVQGSWSILEVNPESTNAIADIKGSHAKYFLLLSPFMGAVDMEVPQGFVNLVKEFASAAGDLIGSSPETGPVYLA
jgi:hypothetical protein